MGNLSSLTYPGNKVVAYTYDDAKRLKTVTDWASRITTYTYDTAGRIGSFLLPNGVTTTFGYDNGSRTQHVDHTKGTTTIASLDYTFDKLGNRKTKVDGSGTENYSYDALYRLSQVQYPGSLQTSYTYDAAGNRLTKTDAAGTKTSTYDIGDQLTNAGDGTGPRSYDANGQLLSAGGTTHTWDARQQLTQVQRGTPPPPPANTAPTANAGPDQAGIYVNHLITLDGSTSTDPEGDQLRFAWTENPANPATGILKGTQAPLPGFTPTLAGTYVFSLTVNDGSLTSAADTVSVTVLAGTPPDIIVNATPASGMSGYVSSASPTGNFFSADSLKTSRNLLGQFLGASQFTLPAAPTNTGLIGATLTLQGKSSTNGTPLDQWVVNLLPTTLDAGFASASFTDLYNSPADSTLAPYVSTVAAGVANSWIFDAAQVNLLKSRATGSGKISLRTNNQLQATPSQVEWHSGNAAVAADKPLLALRYHELPASNRAPIARAGVNQKVTTNTTVTLDGTASYDYESGITYQWTVASGNPEPVTLSSTTSASPTFTPATPGIFTFSLVVTDAASAVSTAATVSITVALPAPPLLTTYVYDGNGDRVKQTADSVVTDNVQNSVPANEQVLMETTGGVTIYSIYGHTLLYTITGTTPHFHHLDSLGSTVAVTNASGAIEQTLSYDVFGVQRSGTGAHVTKRTFTGEENDATGLVYLRARYYDPAVGRFLSRDPFPMKPADTQTVNRYVYVKNNPTNLVDPSGEFWEKPILFFIKRLPVSLQLRILYGAAGVALGAEAATVAHKELEYLKSHPLEVPEVGDGEMEPIYIKDKVFDKALHSWDSFGGSEVNRPIVSRLAVQYGSNLKPGEYFTWTLSLERGMLYLGLARSKTGILTVNTAYYIVANP